MIKIKQQNILQAFILVTGVLVGAYFSNLSINVHEKYGQTDFSRHANMDHGIIDITYDSITPQIEKLEVFKDPLTGWNLYVQTKNFRFTPENANDLFARLKSKGIPYLTRETLLESVHQMQKKKNRKKKFTYNEANWGLADYEFQETRI